MTEPESTETETRASRRLTVSARPSMNSRLGPGTWMKSSEATTKASHWLELGMSQYAPAGWAPASRFAERSGGGQGAVVRPCRQTSCRRTVPSASRSGR